MCLENILITGHSGFIGSNLVPTLSKKYKVVGLSKKQLPRKDILQLTQDLNKIQQNKIPKNTSTIIHLAALTDIAYCQKNPQKCFDVNVSGTQNMLEIARKKDSKFIFLSTSHVFGIPKNLPINENHPKKPTSIYASSKLIGENLCEIYSKTYGLDISILRPFSIFGPYSPPHLVISKIILQLLTKRNLYLGNLYPKRDFLYVSDLVEAIKLIMKNTKNLHSFNVGTGKSYSILEICKILMKITSKKTIIKKDSHTIRKKDVKDVRANNSSLRKLGWRPKIEITEGLKLTYDWFSSHYQ